MAFITSVSGTARQGEQAHSDPHAGTREQEPVGMMQCRQCETQKPYHTGHHNHPCWDRISRGNWRSQPIAKRARASL